MTSEKIKECLLVNTTETAVEHLSIEFNEAKEIKVAKLIFTLCLGILIGMVAMYFVLSK